MFDLNIAQSYMLEHKIDAWLVYDFKGSNSVMWQILGNKRSTTRRNFLFIPSTGEPKMIIHAIDRNLFSDINWKIDYFVSWEDMNLRLKITAGGCKKVAIEYSPLGSIPAVSCVDGGTLELIRSLGVDVCSSADLFQMAACSWSESALKSHLIATKEVAETKDLAFDFIRSKIKAGEKITEFIVQDFIIKEFNRRNLETEGSPIVAVNENSANINYQPTAQKHSVIEKGDWILIDLWARQPTEVNVFSDITWVGYVGEQAPSENAKIFQIVKEAATWLSRI